MHTFLTEPLLQTRITKIAHGDADTIQFINLRLVEQAARDATFASQEIGYHIKRAAWEARHAREKVVIYDRYVACEPMAIDPIDGEEVSAFDEYIPSADLTPEQIVEGRQTVAEIQAALNGLPAKQRELLTMLADGLSQTEIVERTGMSKSSVSHMIARARQAMVATL
jgi:RNA polymerase sigma factor (sigma-70 family)